MPLSDYFVENELNVETVHRYDVPTCDSHTLLAPVAREIVRMLRELDSSHALKFDPSNFPNIADLHTAIRQVLRRVGMNRTHAIRTDHEVEGRPIYVYKKTGRMRAFGDRLQRSVDVLDIIK